MGIMGQTQHGLSTVLYIASWIGLSTVLYIASWIHSAWDSSCYIASWGPCLAFPLHPSSPSLPSSLLPPSSPLPVPHSSPSSLLSPSLLSPPPSPPLPLPHPPTTSSAAWTVHCLVETKMIMQLGKQLPASSKQPVTKRQQTICPKLIIWQRKDQDE